jgi:hypothetical protein
MAAASSGCGNAWVVFPKYPAPYSHPHYEALNEPEVVINQVIAGAKLWQYRSATDYESTLPISVRVICRVQDKKDVAGTVELESLKIAIDGETRYARRFGNVLMSFDGSEKKIEDIYCSSGDGYCKFFCREQLPPEVYERGQELTVTAVISVTRQGRTESRAVSSQYVGAAKRGLLRRPYVP